MSAAAQRVLERLQRARNRRGRGATPCPAHDGQRRIWAPANLITNKLPSSKRVDAERAADDEAA
jgi:hypothetical protein